MVIRRVSEVAEKDQMCRVENVQHFYSSDIFITLVIARLVHSIHTSGSQPRPFSFWTEWFPRLTVDVLLTLYLLEN